MNNYEKDTQKQLEAYKVYLGGMPPDTKIYPRFNSLVDYVGLNEKFRVTEKGFNISPKVDVYETSKEVIQQQPAYKYNERKIINDFQKYIDSTYSQHYIGKNNVQVLDIWEALGSLDTSCRDAAIKYLMRYGKKEGKNKKDLLKALHYIILMINDLEKNSGKQT